ncbi:hypothetical protein B0T18DRAFT_422354 [Schizothecium vesticola]|uniref:Uncharacterized protein n=1 Tax=Schizothecium vesticola TaxID=314040 RepID=A0AA40BQU3_9PEZI|nr:hypothetical protein B0T18DRAFT_422354 [Schizothecium vesticola]
MGAWPGSWQIGLLGMGVPSVILLATWRGLSLEAMLEWRISSGLVSLFSSSFGNEAKTCNRLCPERFSSSFSFGEGLDIWCLSWVSALIPRGKKARKLTPKRRARFKRMTIKQACNPER